MDSVLHQQLLCLANHVRAPSRHEPPPGLEGERLALYRRLFLGNVTGLLSGSFPVLSACLGQERWTALVAHFYAVHCCRTPLFTELSGEFAGFLDEAEWDLPPWAAELAHYEWVEAALMLAEEQTPPILESGDVLGTVWRLSPLAWPLAYLWPVCDIGPDHIPGEQPAQPTFLLAHRRADLSVHFSRLAPLAYSLLDAIGSQATSGREHLQRLAAECGVALEAIEGQGRALLESLCRDGVISV